MICDELNEKLIDTKSTQVDIIFRVLGNGYCIEFQLQEIKRTTNNYCLESLFIVMQDCVLRVLYFRSTASLTTLIAKYHMPISPGQLHFNPRLNRSCFR